MARQALNIANLLSLRPQPLFLRDRCETVLRRSAIAVLEKLDIRDLFPLETRQKAEWRGDFLPGRDRFVGKSAEQGDAATLLNGVDDLEVECFPEALHRRKDIRKRLRPLVSASPGHNFFQFRVVEVQ